MDAQLGITRRRFIATTTAAAAGFTIEPRHVLGGPRFIAPSDQVNVAPIGAGGFAVLHLREWKAGAVALPRPRRWKDADGMGGGECCGNFLHLRHRSFAIAAFAASDTVTSAPKRDLRSSFTSVMRRGTASFACSSSSA